MKRRKIWALALTAAMVLGSFSIASAASEENLTLVNSAVPVSAFSDVLDHWAAPAIDLWAGRGVINGFEGLFKPDDTITRGELAVMLDNMMDYQVIGKNSFQDLKANQFYTAAVLKVNAAGILLGNGLMVRPMDRITREEAATMLSRAFAVQSSSGVLSFEDAGEIASWAKAAVSGMAAKGYIAGYNGKFDPKANLTRAAAVTLIDNIVKAYYTSEGTFTENVAGTAVIKVPGVILKGMTISENLIIAEGVAQGDATLDTVKIQGELVIRGGGENSIYIIGASKISTVKIIKVGGNLRIVISEGNTIQEIEVLAGEEIIIAGDVGILEISAPDTTINVNSANIGSMLVTGDNTAIVVSEESRIQNLVASAKVILSGLGTVATVELNSGADGSSIQTPYTKTFVAPGVTGATGGGGGAIPGGYIGTNNADGSSVTIEADNKTDPATGTIAIVGIGDAYLQPSTGPEPRTDYYTLKTHTTINDLRAIITGFGFSPSRHYTIKVDLRTYPHIDEGDEGIDKDITTAQVTVPGWILNQENVETTVGDLEFLLDAVIINTSDPVGYSSPGVPMTIFEEIQYYVDMANSANHPYTITISGAHVIGETIEIQIVD
jgi:hypothetical protein